MSDRRLSDGSYGPEYGPLSPEHEYDMYGRMPSRGRAPWPLRHGDYPGRLLEQRLRREPFGLSRHPLQPYAPFRILHTNSGVGSGAAINPRQRRESPGLTDDEFREAMDQLRRLEYMPSDPLRKREGRGIIQTRSARAGAPPEEEKTCIICLETFLPREQVVVTPCNHMFHPGCLTPWVKGHGNCPICRFALCEQRNAVTANNGDYGPVDLDLLAMMRTMEEAFSRVRLSDFMSYH